MIRFLSPRSFQSSRPKPTAVKQVPVCSAVGASSYNVALWIAWLCYVFFVVVVQPVSASTMWAVDTTQKVVAFTFDDGPKPESSLPLIELLDRLQLRATFFVVGKEAEANPDLIRRLYDQGHEIANHTFTHTRLPQLSPDAIQNELTRTSGVIRSVTGQGPRFFRPPGGQFNSAIIDIARQSGLTVVLWDVNAGDYYVSDPGRLSLADESRKSTEAKTPWAVIADTVLKEVRPGSIILMHNGGDCVQALPKIIRELRNRGYRFVTLSELTQVGRPRGRSDDNWSTHNVPD
ncbi:polysaccharide deacetylase family protein [bacterium]|nr:polysaccharide deacetylase family protein [bacterium]